MNYKFFVFGCAIIFGAPSHLRAQNVVSPDVATLQTPSKSSSKEDMDALVRHNREQNLRDFLASRGIADKPAQDALIGHVARQEESRNKIRQLGDKLLMALAAPAPQRVAETQLKKLTADYQMALKEFQTLQSQGEKELETQLKVSQNIRLQGIVMVLGLINQASPLLPDWGVPGTVSSLAFQ